MPAHQQTVELKIPTSARATINLSVDGRYCPAIIDSATVKKIVKEYQEEDGLP